VSKNSVSVTYYLSKIFKHNRKRRINIIISINNPVSPIKTRQKHQKILNQTKIKKIQSNKNQLTVSYITFLH